MKKEVIKNRESIWISNHQKELASYAGKWIAVIGNKVIVSGKNLKEIMEQCKKLKLSELPLVPKIPREDEEMYVL